MIELTAENAVVGAILRDEAEFDKAQSRLHADDFADEDARRLFEAAAELRRQGRPIDTVTVRDAVGNEYGEFIEWLVKTVPKGAKTEEYCRIVRQDAVRRLLGEIGRELSEGALARADPNEMKEKARVALDSLPSTTRAADTSLDSTKAWTEQYYLIKKNPAKACRKSGCAKLDGMLGGGLFNGGVYILAGRPGMGKTTVGLGIAESVAMAGDKVLFISLEMSGHQIMSKRLAIYTGLDYSKILAGRLDEKEEPLVLEALVQLAKRRLYTLAGSAMSVADVEACAREVGGLGLLVVDYMGLLRPEREFPRRCDEVAGISAGLGRLARELDIPVLLLCQINRENTKRTDKRPNMADLRDSGSAEQDASAVILLHREGYYGGSGARPEREPIELIVDKNRHGPSGVVRLMWYGASGRVIG